MPRSTKTVTRIAVPLMEAGVPYRNHVVYTEEALRKATDGIRHGSALLGRIFPMEMNVSPVAESVKTAMAGDSTAVIFEVTDDRARDFLCKAFETGDMQCFPACTVNPGNDGTINEFQLNYISFGAARCQK